MCYRAIDLNPFDYVSPLTLAGSDDLPPIVQTAEATLNSLSFIGALPTVTRLQMGPISRKDPLFFIWQTCPPRVERGHHPVFTGTAFGPGAVKIFWAIGSLRSGPRKLNRAQVLFPYRKPATARPIFFDLANTGGARTWTRLYLGSSNHRGFGRKAAQSVQARSSAQTPIEGIFRRPLYTIRFERFLADTASVFSYIVSYIIWRRSCPPRRNRFPVWLSRRKSRCQSRYTFHQRNLRPMEHHSQSRTLIPRARSRSRGRRAI